MIWATVSSWSCFYWVYRASPSLAAKNIINLILVLTICRVFSCVVGTGCLLWPVCSLGKTLLAFALLHSILQGQICLLLHVIVTCNFPQSRFKSKWLDIRLRHWEWNLKRYLGRYPAFSLQCCHHFPSLSCEH